MKPYPEYKETGLAWLPKIPQHWETAKIRELFVERIQKVSDKEYVPLSVSKGGIVPQIATVAKTDNGDNRKQVKIGDFVINSRSDRKGSSGISSYDGSVSLINIVLKPRAQKNRKFIHYLLKSISFVEEYYRNGRGIVADLWTTRYSEMKSISLPVPPVDEQAQIVRYLDAMTTKINKLIRAKKKQIALLQEQKQAIINQAVTKGLDPHVEMKDSGIDWLGKIPKRWTMRTVKSVSGILPGYAFASDEFSTQGKYLLLRGINIGVSGINKEVAVYWNKKITGITHFLLQENDLVLGLDRPWISGGLRISLITSTDLPCLLVQRVCRIRTNDDCLNKFLLYALRSNISLNTLSSVTSGISVPHISTSQVGSVKIPLPSPAEQNEIITFIESELSHIEDLINKVQDGIFLIKEYKDSLISKVITGQLDVRNIVVESIVPDELSDKEFDETDEEFTLEKKE